MTTTTSRYKSTMWVILIHLMGIAYSFYTHQQFVSLSYLYACIWMGAYTQLDQHPYFEYYHLLPLPLLLVAATSLLAGHKRVDIVVHILINIFLMLLGLPFINLNGL